MENNELQPARQVLRENIADAIKNAIFSGELNPGDRITELSWANKLGVSQGPVREALRDLENVGLVEALPFKGCHVRKLSQKDIRDNYTVRICLESKSIRDVIEILSDEELSKLGRDLSGPIQHMEKATEDKDLRSFTASDSDFHKQIILATGNDVLMRLWEQCNMRTWYQIEPLKSGSSLKLLQDGHKRIYKAIMHRDAAKAVSLLENHITVLMDSFIENN